MNNTDNFPLDHETICTNWNSLWLSFGFTEHQWSSRAAKVEEFSRLFVGCSENLHYFISQKLLDDKLLTYKEQLQKREQLIKQSIEDYEEIIDRTGLSSSIEMNKFDELKLKEQEIRNIVWISECMAQKQRAR